jgi:serine/threonine protein kinase
LLAELSLLKSLRHPHLVKFHGAAVVASPLPPAFAEPARVPAGCLPGVAIVTNLAREGSLEEALERSRRSFNNRDETAVLSWYLRLRIARELASALSYLHSLGIIHRDIKTGNILLDRDYHVQVCDHGLAVGADSDQRLVMVGGTDDFMAPEVLLADAQGYGVASDIFSLGLCLASLLHRDGGHPAAGETGGGFLERSARTFFEVDEQELRAAAELPPHLPAMPPPVGAFDEGSGDDAGSDAIGGAVGLVGDAASGREAEAADEVASQKKHEENVRLAIRRAVIGLPDSEGQKPAAQWCCPPSFLELTVQCAQTDPDERPSAEDVEGWLEDLVDITLAPLPPLLPARRSANSFELSVVGFRRGIRRWRSSRSSGGSGSEDGTCHSTSEGAVKLINSRVELTEEREEHKRRYSQQEQEQDQEEDQEEDQEHQRASNSDMAGTIALVCMFLALWEVVIRSQQEGALWDWQQ